MRVPEPVRHAVLKALSKDRDARTGSAADFAAKLREVRDALALPADEGTGEKELAEAREVFSMARRSGSERSGSVSVEELVAIGLVAPPAQVPAGDAARTGVEESTVRLSSAARSTGGTEGGTGRARARTGLLIAAAVVLLFGALAVRLSTRSAKAPPEPRAGARGTLVLNATPWGRVVSVVEEASGAAVDVGPAVTPCRIALPAGRWRIVVRGGDGAEASASVIVTGAAESSVHVDLPGFDVETAVRSFVPDGA
jgi:hypothetical protein